MRRMKTVFSDLVPWILSVSMIIVLFVIIDNLTKKSELKRKHLLNTWLAKKLDLDRWLMDDKMRSTLSPEGQWYLREAVDALAKLIRHDEDNTDPEDGSVYKHLCSHISHDVVPRNPFSIPNTSE
jgi:hypothetical protein